MANLYDKAGLVNIPVGYQDGFLYNIKPEDNTLGFRFNRDSAATRVNKEGLIEQVGYFGPELVQNGNFSELGSELVTNGDFSTSGTPNTSSWSLGWYSNTNNVIISDGKLTMTNSASESDARAYATNGTSSNNIITTNKFYKLQYDIVSNNGVTDFRYYSEAGAFISVPSVEVGSYTIYIRNTSNSLFLFQNRTSNSSISIDNVSVKQVDPNDYWNLGTGWSFGDGKVVKTSGTGASLSQTLPIAVIGKKYKFTFDANVTSGVANASLYGITIPNFTTSGSQEHTVTATSTGGFNFYAAVDFNGSIDNVSVVEVLGDKPRIDYTDSLTSPSFLLEPQSTNLIPYSEDFSLLDERNNAVVTNNVTVSPSGLLNADEITFDGTSEGRVQSSFSSTNGQSYTMSVYLKNKNLSDVTQVWIGFSASGQGQFVTITDEWQRYDVTSVANGTVEYPRVQFTGTGSLYAWGFQAEQLSYATSYIPTAGSTVTRAQETCNGAGNASTFNSTEGVLYAEIAALADDLTFRLLSLSDGTINNRILLGFRNSSNIIYVVVRSQSSTVLTINYSISDITELNKIAFKYQQNNFSLYVNGTEAQSITSGNVPIGLDRLNFDGGNGTDDFYGKTKGVYVFNEALTDDELQQLTGPEYNSFAALAAAYNYTVI